MRARLPAAIPLQGRGGEPRGALTWRLRVLIES
jgi:hypothetical protein